MNEKSTEIWRSREEWAQLMVEASRIAGVRSNNTKELGFSTEYIAGMGHLTNRIFPSHLWKRETKSGPYLYSLEAQRIASERAVKYFGRHQPQNVREEWLVQVIERLYVK